MQEQNLNIRLTLSDQATAGIKRFQGQVNTLSTRMQASVQTFKRVGSEIQQLGMRMAFFGAGITAPFVNAFRIASQYSAEASREMKRFQDSIDELHISIAKDMLPMVQKFVDWVKSLSETWRNLDDETRQNIIETTLAIGVFGTLGATLLLITGYLITMIATFTKLAILFAGFVAINAPLILVATAIVTLITLTGKWKQALKVVGSAIDVIAEAVKMTVNQYKSLWYSLRSLWSLIGRDSENAKKWWNKSNASMNGYKKNVVDLRKIIVGKGTGVGTQAIESLTQKWKNAELSLNQYIEGLKNLMNGFTGASAGASAGGSVQSGKTFMEGFKLGLENSLQSLNDWHAKGVKIANDLASSMTQSFDTFFNDVFRGQLKSAEEYFASFGNSILSMISKIMAEIVAIQVLKNIGFGGFFHEGGTVAKKHYGGMIYAHNGLRVDEVPIIAQTGERVLSRQQNKEYEKGMSRGITVNVNQVIQAWDSNDVYRNRKMLSNSIAEEIRNNANIRKVIRGYA